MGTLSEAQQSLLEANKAEIKDLRNAFRETVTEEQRLALKERRQNLGERRQNLRERRQNLKRRKRRN